MLDNLIKDAEEWIKDAEKRFDWLDVNYYRGAQYAYTLVKRAAEKWDSQNEITKTVKIMIASTVSTSLHITFNILITHIFNNICRNLRRGNTYSFWLS